mmetsp:Transcript_22988/g.48904  ORF Transcript_22988/g.48904 Transcript_22988/m.48904 type:complete len:384 (-) Transcript_22988:3-1154(-)
MRSRDRVPRALDQRDEKDACREPDCGAIHVDRGAERQDKRADGRRDIILLHCAPCRHGEGAGRAGARESHDHCWHHILQHHIWIAPRHQVEKRGQDHQQVEQQPGDVRGDEIADVLDDVPQSLPMLAELAKDERADSDRCYIDEEADHLLDYARDILADLKVRRCLWKQRAENDRGRDHGQNLKLRGVVDDVLWNERGQGIQHLRYHHLVPTHEPCLWGEFVCRHVDKLHIRPNDHRCHQGALKDGQRGREQIIHNDESPHRLGITLLAQHDAGECDRDDDHRKDRGFERAHPQVARPGKQHHHALAAFILLHDAIDDVCLWACLRDESADEQAKDDPQQHAQPVNLCHLLHSLCAAHVLCLHQRAIVGDDLRHVRSRPWCEA